MSVDGEKTIPVRNPATGVEVGRVPALDAAAVDAAVARARRAQPGWAALSFAERGRALRRLCRRMVKDGGVAQAIVAETGKPLFEAELVEVLYTCELTRHLTGRAGRRALGEETRHHLLFAHKRSRIVRQARGVVGVIGPWNFPLLNSFADAVAPLLAGNAVVLKPSPVTPMTSLAVLRLWREEGLPEDVFQVVTGGVETGQALVERADMVFFTGSQAAGRAIARTAGERLIPVVLELGGKSALLVLAGADLERAAHAAAWGAFLNGGQACIRTELILVEDALAEEFTERFVAQILSLRQGLAGAQEAPDVGALIFPPHIARLEDQIADATARGARILTGGKRRDDLPGAFFQPTVLGGVTPDMKIAREETFGPVVPIVSVKDADEALSIANALPFGLSGSVFAPRARALELARRLQTGNVCTNDAMVHYFCVESPLGGTKSSGLGFRHGAESLRQFCTTQTIVEDWWLTAPVANLVKRMLGFPYRPRVAALFRWVLRNLYR